MLISLWCYSGFDVLVPWSGVYGSAFAVQGLMFRVKSLGFKVQGFVFRVP